MLDVVIAGNHDLTFDKQSYPETWKRFRHPKMYDVDECKNMLIQAPNVIYLEDSSVEIQGIKIYGSPWSSLFFFLFQFFLCNFDSHSYVKQAARVL